MKDKNGKNIRRKIAFETKNGIVCTSNNNKTLQLRYPNDDYRYGNVNYKTLSLFFKYLSEGLSLNEANAKAFVEKHDIKIIVDNIMS